MVHSYLAVPFPKWTHTFPSNSTPSTHHRSTARASRLKALSKIDDDDAGSLEQFLHNNSISDFMRFKRGRNSQLQTAIVSYRKKFPWSLSHPFLRVDLVSTIHIADKEYFMTLQKVLEQYDCVLYEMVASRENLESRRNPEAGNKHKASQLRGFNIIGCIQRQMAKLLMLDFQLDCLDYQDENWYHADLDFETFKSLQLEKGESFFTFARDTTLRSTKAIVQPTPVRKDLGPWRSKLLWASRFVPMPLVGLLVIGSICADVGSEPAYPELEALSRLDFSGAMKVFLAKRLTSEFMQLTSDVEEKSVIVGERNRVATEALRRAIDCGNRKIGILYGGGHMPDLGRRLREEFNLVPSGVQWITAWSIRNKNLTTTSSPVFEKLGGMLRWPLNRYQTLALLIFSSVLALDLWFWELFFGATVNWISNAAFDLFRFIDSPRLI
ncbi:tyrosine-protein phosphatase non-receptor type 6 [Striga asiatica]|uniref:Tyrosine-protein phosphatase non-receptor type 6 n=1 Tax=Striga asiatica TaxID=4170 RepID=A0A5A7Q8E3_STRAF|nr:tyrosine-protein phosphatase non-receptor type 6 [Striga asiatica]